MRDVVVIIEKQVDLILDFGPSTLGKPDMNEGDCTVAVDEKRNGQRGDLVTFGQVIGADDDRIVHPLLFDVGTHRRPAVIVPRPSFP